MNSIFLESHNLKNRAGGLGTFNYELIKSLSEQNLDELKITLNLAKIQDVKKEFGSVFRYKKYTSLQRHSIFRVKNKVDVWHSMNQNTKVEPFFSPKKGYILTVHDVNFVEEGAADYSHKSNVLFRKKVERATDIVYISEFAKKMTHQYFDIPKDKKEIVIYNGNPIREILDISSCKPNFKSEKSFFFSIGDFIPRKNYISLLKMMILIPDFNLIIAGNSDRDYGNEVKKFINDNCLSDRVFLVGKISELEKQYYYQKCEAFLFPSIREGFGLPPIEAMRFGKPVFLSTFTSLPEIGGDAAFYWDNFEPDYMKENLFESLHQFYQNKEFYTKKLIDRATFFSWDKAAKSYLKLYKSA